jgi:hypothetical protein
MSPEVEARFERIEALLASVAETQARSAEKQAIANDNFTTELAKTEANQAIFQSNQAVFQANQAVFQADQAALQAKLAVLEVNLAKTEAIANSNARAIEATANESAETRRNLAELVVIVSNFVKATNSRLITLEDK